MSGAILSHARVSTESGRNLEAKFALVTRFLFGRRQEEQAAGVLFKLAEKQDPAQRPGRGEKDRVRVGGRSRGMHAVQSGQVSLPGCLFEIYVIK